MEIVVCLSLLDALAYNYLMPIARHHVVSKLWIVRPEETEFGPIPKTEYCLAPDKTLPGRLARMAAHCFRLARRKEVRGFVSFNPIPYGLIGAAAARSVGKPFHFGFIGSDWYRDAQGPFGPILRPVLRRADFMTATGERMRDQMIERGFDSSRLSILPHSIDVDQFAISSPEESEFTFIFVGQLIYRKRVDLILRAFSRVLRANGDATLCIVGDGARAGELKALAGELGIDGAVSFAGYTTDVASYMARARIAVMASEMEGFPFALVEGMCSGLVPISTPVGTIPDLIKNEENGLLVPRDDVDALAGAMMRIAGDDALYERLRSNVLQMRDHFSYDRATEVWDEWLRTLD